MILRELLHGEASLASRALRELRPECAALATPEAFDRWIDEVQRADLPPPGKRQHYRADLVGLAVRNLEGVEMGRVAQFVDAPTGPVMVVKDVEGREHWVLATPQYLRKVEVDAGLILVDWPLDSE